jgi:N-acetylneuraminic acid mutarotase
MRVLASTLFALLMIAFSGCGGSSTSTPTPPPPPPPSTANEWTWMSGSNTVNAIGVYGTLGVASAGNVPGAREDAVSWTDKSGNFWLFGGLGFDSIGGPNGWLNDLWEFNPTTKEWTWMSGSNNYNASGVYGTLGTPSTNNVPGARYGAVSWTDLSGNFWLFGGEGYNSAGTFGNLNDLWEFSPTTKEWTWVSGSNATGAIPVYGTQGVGSANNTPGGRELAVSWTDSSGNFWLFGGEGAGNDFGDLWEFSPTTTEWTWVSGSDTPNAVGVYGTQGVASANNVPGSRKSAVSWLDSSGNLWLFGGLGLASTRPTTGYLNDLWEFSPATKEWTWVSGSETGGAVGVYGTLGVASTTNVPGGRESAVSWTDSSGNLWLFGGFDYDSETDPDTGTYGYLNDLWEFSPTTKKWTWMSGSNTANTSGVYGTQDVASASNVPGARANSGTWTDSSGNLWLFGGEGYDSELSAGVLNDLWRYEP